MLRTASRRYRSPSLGKRVAEPCTAQTRQHKCKGGFLICRTIQQISFCVFLYFLQVDADFPPKVNDQVPDFLPAPSPVLSRNWALHVADHLESELRKREMVACDRLHPKGVGRGGRCVCGSGSLRKGGSQAGRERRAGGLRSIAAKPTNRGGRGPATGTNTVRSCLVHSTVLLVLCLPPPPPCDGLVGPHAPTISAEAYSRRSPGEPLQLQRDTGHTPVSRTPPPYQKIPEERFPRKYEDGLPRPPSKSKGSSTLAARLACLLTNGIGFLRHLSHLQGLLPLRA